MNFHEKLTLKVLFGEIGINSIITYDMVKNWIN